VHLNADHPQLITVAHIIHVVVLRHHTLPVLPGLALLPDYRGIGNCAVILLRPFVIYRAETAQLNILIVNETFRTEVINILLTYWIRLEPLLFHSQYNWSVIHIASVLNKNIETFVISVVVFRCSFIAKCLLPTWQSFDIFHADMRMHRPENCWLTVWMNVLFRNDHYTIWNWLFCELFTLTFQWHGWNFLWNVNI
jgi:hypothetical protein